MDSVGSVLRRAGRPISVDARGFPGMPGAEDVLRHFSTPRSFMLLSIDERDEDDDRLLLESLPLFAHASDASRSSLSSIKTTVCNALRDLTDELPSQLL